ncbi:MAG: coniferyl aldehyde dehydrogenase [Proteobacteria bacterium]|nr:coniferyl aldehyde dehydrogenase [Pseudomonadota bacterium]
MKLQAVEIRPIRRRHVHAKHLETGASKRGGAVNHRLDCGDRFIALRSLAQSVKGVTRDAKFHVASLSVPQDTRCRTLRWEDIPRDPSKRGNATSRRTQYCLGVNSEGKLGASAAGADHSDRETLGAILARQRQAFHTESLPTYEDRVAHLRAIQRFVRDHKQALCDAISADYGHRSPHETLLTEVLPVIQGIDHACRHLRSWMRVQRRSVDITFLGSRNRVIPQPLGVIGAIVPWNFPLNLSFVPLTAILAAGNRAMVKMSENSRTLTRLLIDRMPTYLPTDRLTFVEETGGIGEAFSSLPFDHLLFTGSGETGRRVMSAAAANLVPVTLELGGRSPAIVCEDFPVATAAERIIQVKCLNAGQICTTVDHAFVPHAAVDAFVAHARMVVPRQYRSIDTPDYTSVIDDRSFNRLKATIEDARSRGATVIPLLPGPPWNATTRKFAPHLVLNAPADADVMTREIFGPILPVIGYTNLDEVVTTIIAGPRPLALYPFTNDESVAQRIVDRVMSGGVTVNHALLHVAQHDLPFGGVGASGMGHYHGREGFTTFSKMRPVLYQGPIDAMRWLSPPYGTLASRVLSFLTR